MREKKWQTNSKIEKDTVNKNKDRKRSSKQRQKITQEVKTKIEKDTVNKNYDRQKRDIYQRQKNDSKKDRKET